MKSGALGEVSQRLGSKTDGLGQIVGSGGGGLVDLFVGRGIDGLIDWGGDEMR